MALAHYSADPLDLPHPLKSAYPYPDFIKKARAIPVRNPPK